MSVPFVDPPPAIVHGRAAVGVAWLLSRAVERGDLDTIPEVVRAETVAAIHAVELASVAWARRHTTAANGSPNGNTAARRAGDGSCSPHDVLTTTEAAHLLGVGERRARDLAASGLGRRLGGRWVLDRRAVEAEAARRGAA